MENSKTDYALLATPTEAYKHGGDVYGAMRTLGLPLCEIIDYSANINPLIEVSWLRETLSQYMERVLHYPDPENTELVLAIARRFQLAPDNIVVGNGATPLIAQLVNAIKPDRARLQGPTFGEYEKALRRAQVPISYGICDPKTLSIDLDTLAIQDLMPGEIGLIFICNPNNPTGQMWSVEALVSFLERVPSSCYVVVDEAFIEFTRGGEVNSVVPYLQRFSNLIVLRSATKFFGMPGLRLGYLLTGDKGLAQEMVRDLPLWQINVLASALYIEGIGRHRLQVETADLIHREREVLMGALSERQFEVWPSWANYFVVRPPREIDLSARLLGFGILVRSCDNYVGLPKGLYRFAVKGPNERDKLLKALDIIADEL